MGLMDYLRTRKRHKEGLALLERVTHQSLQDNEISAQDLERMNRVEAEYQLDPAKAQAVVDRVRISHAQSVLNPEIHRILEDGRYDEEEEQRLTALVTKLNVGQLPADVQQILAKAKQFHRIHEGDLPVAAADINLSKGEVCHFSAPATWNELRTRTQRYNYSGPSARIRICKGFYYRVGSMKIDPVRTEYLHEVDRGNLYITNKRVVFHGYKKNSATRLNKILAVDPYTDAIELEKESGRNPIFTLREPELATAILGRLFNA